MQTHRQTSSLFAPLIALGDEDLPGDEEQVVKTEDFSLTEPEASHALAAPLLPLLEMPRTYVCPGEKHAIPRSIHLARLAAFYPNCRQCEHRTDTGQLPRAMLGRLEQSARRVEPASPFGSEGVRGAYLNHLTRRTASRIAAAVAEHLWVNRPLIGHTPTAENIEPLHPGRRATGPTVIIGHDSRASSPDICVGVGGSLRSMGCEVIDVGRVSRPCLLFAVDHLQAAAGMYITGSGCPGSWTGIDIVGAGGIPWSLNGTLADIERRYQTQVSRPTRQGGLQRYFDPSVPFRASLLKHYQELRRTRVVCACSELTVFDTLVPLFDELSCELIPLTIAPSRPEGAGGRKNQTAVIADAIHQSAADCGVIIGEEGEAFELVRSDGRSLSHTDVLQHLLTRSGSSQGAGPVAIGPGVDEQSRGAVSALGFAIEFIAAGEEAMARWMQKQTSGIGVQAGGRYWFRDTFPRCDAAVTLGQLLPIINPHG